jgi:tetratricopeptide (TPR) repeat protein
VPIDRESTLRQADRLQQQGRLDAAIAEYVRLVAEQPRDWNAINALGDLYVRAGDVDRAVAQFLQIADHLFAEGFLPKAAAVYKKTLKTKPDHEHTLLRLSEIAATQELLADARAYLRQLWELRSERGDDHGAAQCLIRLALLPEADAETKLTGARASKALGETDRAVTLFRAAAEQLEKAGRSPAALDALAQVVVLDPSATDLRRDLVARYVAAGQIDAAEQLLDPKTAGTDPDLLLALARIQLTRNDDAEARSTLTRVVAVAPDRRTDILRLAGDLGRRGEPDRAFSCAEVIVDEAILRADWDHAIDVLQSFLVHGAYIPALVKLVQVAGDAGLVDAVQEAEERLADAYIATADGQEAQRIAERLLARAPDSDVHADRLRRAVALVGVDDPEGAVRLIRERHQDPDLLALAGPAPDREPEMVTRLEVGEEPLLREETETPEEPEGPVEFDLSEMVAALGAPVAAAPLSAPVPTPDLESVFEGMRPHSADFGSIADAAARYEQALQRLEKGEAREALTELETVARVPGLRFQAAARLGREYVALGRLQTGIYWLERAAEVPAPSHDDGLAVLYELGIALDAMGERTRALAVLMEIDETGYRDVRERIDALVRAQDRSRA